MLILPCHHLIDPCLSACVFVDSMRLAAALTTERELQEARRKQTERPCHSDASEEASESFGV